jgi:hypothetical protein
VVNRVALLAAIGVVTACSPGTSPPSSPPSQYDRTGRYPGACSLLRVDDDGNRRRTERTYDGERLISEVTFEEDGEGKTVRSRRYIYDAHGRQIRIDEFEGSDRQSSWLTYDEKGRWIATDIDRSGNGDIIRRNERGYDEDGHVSYQRTVTRPDNTVVEFHRFERDENGKVVLELVDFPLEDRGERIEFQHDEKGRITERVHHDLPVDTLTQRDVYSFGPSGRLASMVRHGDIRLTQRYRHDDHGNLLRVDTWDEAGEPIAATVYDYSCWNG